MLVATFGASGESSGKTISYENGRFFLEGFGPITPKAILDYDRQGQLHWATEGSRAWVQSLTASGAPAPAAPAAPKKGLSGGAKIALALGAALVLAIVIAAAVMGSGGESGAPSISTAELHQRLAESLSVVVKSCSVDDGEADIVLRDSGPSKSSDYQAAAERDCFDAFRVVFAPDSGIATATVEVQVERSDQFGYAVWDPVYKATLRSEDVSTIDWDTATPSDLREVWSVDFRKSYMTP
jgi:hypothetical protein